jgi:hypothetical protein
MSLINPLTIALAGQGLQYAAGNSAQDDAEKARKKQEQEQAMMNAIAAFRGGQAGQAQGGGQLSGKTQLLSSLGQLAPLLGMLGGGGSKSPQSPNAADLNLNRPAAPTFRGFQ